MSAKQLKIWDSYTAGPLQQIDTGSRQATLYLKRLELINSWASGNKYFKLKYVLLDAIENGIKVIVSKGGMFSNHLAALSQACEEFGIRFVAVVRSFTPDEDNPCILQMRARGDKIIYTSPSDYAEFDASSAVEIDSGALFIPEGGLSEPGIRGSAEIAQECIVVNPTHVVVAGGTMSTAIGILSALPALCKLIIVPAWKGCTTNYINDVINRYEVTYKSSWMLWPDDHFGGFGKFNDELIEYIQGFKAKHNILLDPVYTGKLMYAIEQKMAENYFSSDDTIVAIHSGGLQGIAGYKYRFPDRWKDV